MNKTATHLPVIRFDRDLAQSSGQIAAGRIAQALGQACRDSGFFYLAQSNLPPDQIEAAFTQAKAFFDLPTATKMQLLRSPQTNCGYVPLQAEALNPQRPGDGKEAFNIGLETLWPTEPSPFRSVLEPFYHACIEQIAMPLLRVLALALDLPEAFFVERHGQNFLLRLLHYPPLAQFEANQLRAGEHTDYGTLTLLFQESLLQEPLLQASATNSNQYESQTGSLEILTQQGIWTPAPAIPGTILINVGDALQRWTNDRLRSTPHRVELPQINQSQASQSQASQSRYSMALFCDPNPEVEIACLPMGLTHSPARYPPIRYQDYLQERFAATYAP